MKFFFVFLILYIVLLVDPCSRGWRYQRFGQGDDISVHHGSPNDGDRDENDDLEDKPNVVASYHFDEPPGQQFFGAKDLQERCFCCGTNGKRNLVQMTKKEFQNAVQLLWLADANDRIDFVLWEGQKNFDGVRNLLDFQRRVNSGERVTKAKFPLFKKVKSTVWDDPSNIILKDLFTAYYTKESDLIKELSQQLLHSVITSTTNYVMQILRAILSKCHFNKAMSESEFQRFMHELWFGKIEKTYLIDPDSSSFRHIFVGEEKYEGDYPYRPKKLVDGLHGWLKLLFLQQFYADNFKYTGFTALFKQTSVERDKRRARVASIQCRIIETERGMFWREGGSVIFGTSIAFDLAFYTLTYAAFPDQEIRLYLGDCTPIILKTLSYTTDANEQRLLSAYATPWFDGINQDRCPPYIRAGKSHPDAQHPDDESLYTM